MKFKFSISNVLLVTALVGMALGWVLHYTRMRDDYNSLKAKYAANTKELNNIISFDRQYDKGLGLAIDDCINSVMTVESFAKADDLQPIVQEIKTRRLLVRLNAAQSVNNRRPSELDGIDVK